MINYAQISNGMVPDAARLLEVEIVCLRSLCEQRGNEPLVDEVVLEGRLFIARELLCFATPQHKFDLGSNEATGGCLIKVFYL